MKRTQRKEYHLVTREPGGEVGNSIKPYRVQKSAIFIEWKEGSSECHYRTGRTLGLNTESVEYTALCDLGHNPGGWK